MKAFLQPLRLSALCLALVFLPLGRSLAQETKTNASASKVKPREFAEFVENLPKADVAKLRGNKANEVAVELTKKVQEAEVGKEGTFIVKVARVETMQVPEKTEVMWRVECEHERIKAGSVGIELWAWVSVASDPSGIVAKARPGQVLTVSGKINGTDIRMASGQPQLWLGLDATSVKAGK